MPDLTELHTILRHIAYEVLAEEPVIPLVATTEFDMALAERIATAQVARLSDLGLTEEATDA